MKEIFYNLDTQYIWFAEFEFENGMTLKVPLVLIFEYEPKTDMFSHYHYYIMPDCFNQMMIIRKETLRKT